MSNCYERALAELFDVPVERVPALRGDRWSDQVRRFARKWGFDAVFLPGDAIDRVSGYSILSYIMPNGKTHAELLLDGEAKGVPVLWTVFLRAAA